MRNAAQRQDIGGHCPPDRVVESNDLRIQRRRYVVGPGVGEGPVGADQRLIRGRFDGGSGEVRLTSLGVLCGVPHELEGGVRGRLNRRSGVGFPAACGQSRGVAHDEGGQRSRRAEDPVGGTPGQPEEWLELDAEPGDIQRLRQLLAPLAQQLVLFFAFGHCYSFSSGGFVWRHGAVHAESGRVDPSVDIRR